MRGIRATRARGVFTLAAVFALVLAISDTASATHKVDFTCSPACSVFVGTTVTLTATTNASKPTNPQWDLNDDGIYGDATGFVVQQTFTKAGTYQVSVQVSESDDPKDVATATHTISVLKPAPEPAYGTPFGPDYVEALNEAYNENGFPTWEAAPKGPLGNPQTGVPKGRIEVLTRKPSAGRPVKLAVTAKLVGGQILGIKWDLDGDGEFDDAFGEQITTMFARPGRSHVSALVEGNLTRNTIVRRSIELGGTLASPSPAVMASQPLVNHLDGDFEHGLKGWRSTGPAFAREPITGRTILLSRILDTPGRVGGSYADIPESIDVHGKQYVSSYQPRLKARGMDPVARAKLATGVLYSPRFSIDRRYLTLRLGGDDHGSRSHPAVAVELWTRKGNSSFQLRRVLGVGPSPVMHAETLDLRAQRGQQGVLVFRDQSDDADGSMDGVVLTNRAKGGAPNPFATRVFGFADAHGHLMAHVGFGAMNPGPAQFTNGFGFRPYMGVPGGADGCDAPGTPGGAAGLYSTFPFLYYRDTLMDKRNHFGGLTGNTVVNTVESGFMAGDDHSPAAGPMHEEMHVTELKRAWEAGLRLTTVLALNAPGMEWVMGVPHDDNISLTGDSDAILATIAATRQLAELNCDWMQVVYSPGQALDAIAAGKLAVILGVEVPRLGDLRDVDPANPTRGLFHSGDHMRFDSIDQEVEWLWRIGIRHVVLIHSVDNRLGGSAVFQDLYNTQNDLLHRNLPTVKSEEGALNNDRLGNNVREGGTSCYRLSAAHVGQSLPGIAGAWDLSDDWLAVNDPVGRCPHRYGFFFKVSSSESCSDNPIVRNEAGPHGRGECVGFHLAVKQNLLDIYGELGFTHAGAYPVRVAAYDNPASTASLSIDPPGTPHFPPETGMVNQEGITPEGLGYVHELMKHGMLIDIEHMSDAARRTLMDDTALSPLWEHSTPGEACPHGDLYPVTPGGALRCYYNVYPVLSSHTVFRAQSLLRTAERYYQPNEQQRTPAEVEFIRRTGGLVAPVVLQPPRDHLTAWSDYAGVTNPGHNPSAYYVPGVDSPVHSTVPQDCAGSSKSFAEALLYADEKMRRHGIALASDMPFVGGTSPRFPLHPGETAPLHIHFRETLLANNCRAWRHISLDPDPDHPELSDTQKWVELHDGQYNFAQNDATRVRYAADASVDVTANDGTSHEGLIREGPNDVFSYPPPVGGPGPWIENAFFPADRPVVTKARDGDFNVTGLDRYGKLPDLLQDTRNVGVQPSDMAPLFNSAQDYVDMWARAYRIAGCFSHGFIERDFCTGGTPISTEAFSASCFGTCPQDPGRGLLRTWKGTDPEIRHFDWCPNLGDAALPPGEPTCASLR